MGWDRGQRWRGEGGWSEREAVSSCISGSSAGHATDDKDGVLTTRRYPDRRERKVEGQGQHVSSARTGGRPSVQRSTYFRLSNEQGEGRVSMTGKRRWDEERVDV